MSSSLDTVKKQENTVYTISKKSIWGLTTYFIFLLLAGAVVLSMVIFEVGKIQNSVVLQKTVYSSMATCVMLCSIQYLKRIYKACLTERMVAPVDGEQLKEIGNILYFVLRPLFSVCFSLVGIFAILSGLIIITTSIDYAVNERFLYVCVIMSGFVGFSIGSVLDKFEAMSIKKVAEILGPKETTGGTING